MSETLFEIMIFIWAASPLVFLTLFIVYFVKYRELKKHLQTMDHGADNGKVCHVPDVMPMPQPAPATAPPKVRKPINRQNLLYTLVMFIGVFLIIMSAVIFATSTWQYQTVAVKIILLISAAVICYGAFVLAFKKFGLLQTSVAFYILGSIFLSAAVLAIGYFSLFGSWFSFHGDGRWFIGVASLGLLTAAACLGSVIFSKKWINWISLAAAIAAIFCLAMFIKPENCSAGIAFALIAMVMAFAKPFRYFTDIPPMILAAISIFCMQPETLTAVALAGGVLAVAANAVMASRHMLSGYALVISIFVLSMFADFARSYQTQMILAGAAICIVGILTQILNREYFVRLRLPFARIGTLILAIMVANEQLEIINYESNDPFSAYPLVLIAMGAYWTVIYACRRKNWQLGAVLAAWPVIAAFVMLEYTELIAEKWLFMIPLAACIAYILAGRGKNIVMMEKVGQVGALLMVIIVLLVSMINDVGTAYLMVCLAALAAVYYLGCSKLTNFGFFLPVAIAIYDVMDIPGIDTTLGRYYGIGIFLACIIAGRLIYRQFLKDKKLDGLTLGSLVVPIIFCDNAQDQHLWLFIGMLLLAVFAFSFYRRLSALGDKIALEAGMIFLALSIFVQDFFRWPEVMTLKVYLLIPLVVLLITKRYIFVNKGLGLAVYIYSAAAMLALLIEAMDSGLLTDALFIGGTAFVITAVSAVRKNVRWCILGGVSLVIIVVYLSRDFWMSLPWWAYLLMAGAALTGIAIRHEAKKKGHDDEGHSEPGQ